MAGRSRPYEEYQDEQLRNPEYALGYLNFALESKEEDAEEYFMVALSNVARAYGVSDIAEKSNLGRESLYKTLSKSGNPKFTTLIAILKVMGLTIEIKRDKKSS